MAYCDLDDIIDLTGFDISPTSTPDEDATNRAIDRIAGEIDGVLTAAGYELPITAQGALDMLNQYNAFGAGPQVWHMRFPGEADEPANVAYWRDQYKDFLNRLKKGEQKLPGEEITSEEDVAFAIVPHPSRDRYWLTGQSLE